MKTTTSILLSIFGFITLLSCDNKLPKEENKNETAHALQEENYSSHLESKRGYNNLVESLYAELVSKDMNLKKLESEIDKLNTSKHTATESFEGFNEKNKTYFSSANLYVSAIQDSLVKDKMKTLLAEQLSKYNSTIAKHNDLLKLIETKQMTISDLHNVIKIVKTLPLIDRYQINNLPKTNTLENYINQQDQTIRLADTLSRY